MPALPSPAVLMFGTNAPVPERQTLTAGPLSAVLEGGQLRAICWQGHEAMRGIAFLVRDANWGTYEAQLTGTRVVQTAEGFEVSYAGTCEGPGARGPQALAFTARIVGQARGTLAFEVHLTPQTDFVTNRAGLVVLHPLDGVAGEPVMLTHTDGRTEAARFPKHVSGSQPFFDLRALAHEVRPGVTCTCTMEGEAFETEDQRNWTDASFKTYGRPLAKPFPFTLPAGQLVSQAVRLSFAAAGPSPRLVVEGPAAETFQLGPPAGRLPALALAVAPEELAATEAHGEALRALRPAWLVGRCEAQTDPAYLRALARLAHEVNAQVWLEAPVACAADVEHELAPLAALVAEAGLPLGALTLTPRALLRGGPGADPATQAALFAAARRAFPGVRLGGGVMTHFTELNRHPPPRDGIDFVTHTTCPIVHAADDESVMQTLQALPWVFASAWQLTNAPAYFIGPSAIGLRLHPAGAGPAPNPRGLRVPMAGSDPRQRGLFGAAYYAGYAAQAARAGIEVLTLGALTGPSGVVASPGSCAVPGPMHAPACVYPAFHVLRWLAEAQGRPRLGCSAHPGTAVDAFAFAADAQRVLILANVTERPQLVHLLAAPHARAQVLASDNVREAAHALHGLGGPDEGNGLEDGERLLLPPYAVARVVV